MSPIRFIVAAVLTWAVTAPVVGQQRIPIERADDLPRHTYRVTSAIELMQELPNGLLKSGNSSQ